MSPEVSACIRKRGGQAEASAANGRKGFPKRVHLVCSGGTGEAAGTRNSTKAASPHLHGPAAAAEHAVERFLHCALARLAGLAARLARHLGRQVSQAHGGVSKHSRQASLCGGQL